jgi:PAS domain S-box-containing protein
MKTDKQSKTKPNILLVDDNYPNLYMLEMAIKPLDVNIITALSGEEALTKIKGKEIALAITDIRMPGMDGVELAKIIHDDKSRELVPIIFLTCIAKDELELEKCYAAGAIDFILKPFNNYILLSKVKIFLEFFSQKQHILKQKKELEQKANDLARINKTMAEAEEALTDSENLYRTLVNASPEAIILLDREHRISDVSEITPEIWGFKDKPELLGSFFPDHISPEEITKFHEYLKLTKSKGLAQNIEINLKRGDHSIFMAEISIALIDEIENKPFAYMVIIRDISQRKKMELQMVHNARLLSLGEMATGIAHEINQPLNNISLTLENVFSEIQSKRPVAQNYFKDKSERIFDNIYRMRSIIDHIRDFSRDQTDFFSALFEINTSISNAISMISAQFKYRNIELILDIDNEIPQILGNTFKFEQVILNLLINAKDAMEDKKEMMQKSFPMCIKIKTHHNKKFVFVEITDNGIGIKQDELDKIILPFYTTKAAGKGTGLGLSISHGIIKEMNGTLEILSKHRIETTVKIKLPIGKTFIDNPVDKVHSN